MKKILLTLSLLCLLGTKLPLYASMLPDNLQIHGFASQAFILTSDNNFFGNSPDGSFEFSELGLNTSFQPTPDLLFSAQGLSRRAGEDDNGALQLDYALIDYNLLSKESGNLGLRLGRIKNPLGLYNDTRDVAFTRPSLFLPQSIYFDRTRNLALSADGLHLYLDHRSTLGDFFFEFGVVYPNAENNQTRLAFLGKQTGDLDPDFSYVGRLIFERDGGRIRLGISGAVVEMESTVNAQEGDIRFVPVILSAQYNTEFWSLTSEYAQRYSRFNNVGNRNSSFTGESFYLQYTYRLAKKLEALLRYDVLYQNKDDRDGEKFSAASGSPAYGQFAKDWTAGLRWDITPSWMARIEYHYVDGTAWLPLADNPSATKRYWDMLSLLISFRF